jgi:hypothetical protein
VGTPEGNEYSVGLPLGGQYYCIVLNKQELLEEIKTLHELPEEIITEEEFSAEIIIKFKLLEETISTNSCRIPLSIRNFYW